MSDEQIFDLNTVMPLSFVKNYLRIDNDLDDGFLAHAVESAAIFARQASGLKLVSAEEFSEDIRQAILYHVASMYQNREGDVFVPEAAMEVYKTRRGVRIGLSD